MRVITFVFLAFVALNGTSCSSQNQKSRHLRVNLYCEPCSLDPRTAVDLTSCNMLVMLFEGLTRIGDDHIPKPAVAKSIDISEDGLTYTFSLRAANWSDGTPITSHDFVFAWTSILEPSFPASFAYKLFIIKNAKQIKAGELAMEELGIRAIDDATFEVTLAHKAPYFLELLAFPTFFPVKSNLHQKDSLWAEQAGESYICNGPFTLASWDHENEIQVKKNPTYWDRKNVHLEGIDLVMINDTMTEYYMYESNELDIAGSPISNLPFEVLGPLHKKGELIELPLTGVYFYKINTEAFPFTNKKIRQAFAYAINRDELICHVLELPQLAATSFVPPLTKTKKNLSCFEDGNLLLAKKVFEEGLEELGISRHDFPAVTFLYNTNREHKRLAEAISQQWEKAFGIKVSLSHADWNVYLSKLLHKEFSIARAGWIGDMNDPISFLAPYKYRDDPNWGGNNNTGWEHADFQALLDKSEKQSDTLQRLNILEEAEQCLLEEMPVIPLYFMTVFYVKKPYVQDIFYSRFGIVDFKKARLL